MLASGARMADDAAAYFPDTDSKNNAEYITTGESYENQNQNGTGSVAGVQPWPQGCNGISVANADENPFEMTELSSGYMVAVRRAQQRTDR